MENGFLEDEFFAWAVTGWDGVTETSPRRHIIMTVVKYRRKVTIRNQPSYAGKKISRVIREIFCNNKEASA